MVCEKDFVDYLVPGFRAASLDLTRGRDKIHQFVRACETFGDASPPVESAAAGSGGDAEKEAFNSAKESSARSTPASLYLYYPTGFRADLARAYMKQLGPSAPPSVSTVVSASDGILQGQTEPSLAEFQ